MLPLKGWESRKVHSETPFQDGQDIFLSKMVGNIPTIFCGFLAQSLFQDGIVKSEYLKVPEFRVILGRLSRMKWLDACDLWKTLCRRNSRNTPTLAVILKRPHNSYRAPQIRTALPMHMLICTQPTTSTPFLYTSSLFTTCIHAHLPLSFVVNTLVRFTRAPDLFLEVV